MKNFAKLFCSALFLALAACQVQPLYGTFGPGGAPAIGDNLSQVEIAPVGGRTGIALRNELIFVLTGGGQAVTNGRYKLAIAMQESATPTQYEQISGRATSAMNYTSATYVLTDTATGTKLYQSRSFARSTFDQDVNRFANVRAERDAEDRAIKVLAQEIRNSLAAYFAQKQQSY
ncbi:MAG: LPS assembly lipoprotein LptE [Pseudomonadota bacterium]